MNFTYRDGSNNKYTLHGNTISYDPIKPENSSSGIYDGGDPVEKELVESEIEQLSIIVQSILDLPENDLQKRSMGSGYVFAEGRSIILSMRSVLKINLEKVLKEIVVSS